MKIVVTGVDIHKEMESIGYDINVRTCQNILKGEKGTSLNRSGVSRARQKIKNEKIKIEVEKRISEINEMGDIIRHTFTYLEDVVLSSNLKYFKIAFLKNELRFVSTTMQVSVDIDELNKELELLEVIMKILNRD